MKPQHLAIIMDGNGRWATARGLPRMDGHRAGVDVALDIVKYCGELKIPSLTLYTFSSENWARPADEVSGLMGLLQGYLTKKIDTLLENGVRVSTIGVMEHLPTAVQSALRRVCEETAGGDRMRLTLALSYGSRDEIIRAVQKIAQKVEQGELSPSAITEDVLSAHLDTAGIPDPDFWIRTSGEMRLSNFLLWQLSYTELFVSPAYWPDFKRADLDLALADFAKRQRRFGKTSEQVAAGHLA